MKIMDLPLENILISNYNGLMDNYKMDDTISKISKVRRSANLWLTKEMEKVGMEGFVPSHGEILMGLFYEEALTMTQIAQNINKDPSTVTALVNKLKKNGYVETQKSPKSGRITLVMMTDKGKVLKKDFLAISKILNQTYCEGIDAKELAIFQKVLMEIQANFDHKNLGGKQSG